jgi:NAD(P)H-dependent FMN reductase
MRSSPSVSIVALCGSMGRNSNTSKALTLALEGACEAGAQTTLLELHDYQLPFAGQTYDYTPFPDVERLTSQIRAAHGVLWGTPEYHGSYTGVLKNALDLMGFDEFQGKMIGLVGVAGAASVLLTHCRICAPVGRQLHAWVLPQQVSIARVSQGVRCRGQGAGCRCGKALERNRTRCGAL